MNSPSLLKPPYRLSAMDWAGLILAALLLIWFYFFYPAYMAGTQSAMRWLMKAWNKETDYEHGWMVPLLCVYMLKSAVGHYRGIEYKPSLKGLWMVLVGGLLCLLAVRTQQGRVVIGALPFVLTGLCWCYWGGRAALCYAFPFFFMWMSIPLPGFQQATVSMQLLATDAAHWGAGLLGVKTIVQGTNISSATGAWDTYSVAGGCSGMRSLMALVMISIAWGYLAFSLSLWKRVLLGLSAIPLAIAGNAFRVASIFVFAEYVSPKFASKTWHDWSGLLFFFPASMLGLMILHGLLAGEIPFLKKRKVVVRQAKLTPADSTEV